VDQLKVNNPSRDRSRSETELNMFVNLKITNVCIISFFCFVFAGLNLKKKLFGFFLLVFNFFIGLELVLFYEIVTNYYILILIYFLFLLIRTKTGHEPTRSK